MAEPTVTRKDLRRAICRTARMAFYLKYPDGVLSVGSDSASDSIVNTKLTQADDSWNNGFLLLTSTGALNGEERPIADFSAVNDKLVLEYPLDAAPSTGDQFEITEVWPPSLIHSVMNRVIREGEQYFPNVVVDESITLVKDKLEYDLSGLAVPPKKILQIYTERAYGTLNGTATAGDGTSLTDATRTWEADAHIGKYVGIYDGSGKGQFQTITDNTSDILTVASWDSDAGNPASDSVYRMWDANYQVGNWRRLVAVGFDAQEYPGKLYLKHLPVDSYGMRMRIIYLADPQELTADSDLTTVSQEFVIYKTLAHLHAGMLGNTKADAQKHMNVVNTYLQMAEMYANTHQRRIPAGTLWTEEDPSYRGQQYSEEINPLEW